MFYSERIKGNDNNKYIQVLFLAMCFFFILFMHVDVFQPASHPASRLVRSGTLICFACVYHNHLFAHAFKASFNWYHLHLLWTRFTRYLPTSADHRDSSKCIERACSSVCSYMYEIKSNQFLLSEDLTLAN